jgi:hypothetical protein
LSWCDTAENDGIPNEKGWNFMKFLKRKNIICFVIGMLTFGVAVILYSIFIGVKTPEPGVTVENQGEICFWVDENGDMIASVSPEGCFSTTCTRQVQKVGKAVIDDRDFGLRFETRFVLAEASRFPLPCTDNCSGGGRIDFDLGLLEVGDYLVWHGEEKIGTLMVFSGLPTPKQCFPN